MRLGRHPSPVSNSVIFAAESAIRLCGAHDCHGTVVRRCRTTVPTVSRARGEEVPCEPLGLRGQARGRSAPERRDGLTDDERVAGIDVEDLLGYDAGVATGEDDEHGELPTSEVAPGLNRLRTAGSVPRHVLGVALG